MRYQYLESFQEDLLLCKPLPTNTSGAEIFKLIDEVFTMSGIPWDNCVDVFTGGAKAMTGKTSGVISRIKQKVKECSSSHCVLHRHALAGKICRLPWRKSWMKVWKSRPKNTRLFKMLCEDMGSLHTSLLLHTEVRWLSRGKILTRLFEMKPEVRIFLIDDDFALGDSCVMSAGSWNWRI